MAQPGFFRKLGGRHALFHPIFLYVLPNCFKERFVIEIKRPHSITTTKIIPSAWWFVCSPMADMFFLLFYFFRVKMRATYLFRRETL